MEITIPGIFSLDGFGTFFWTWINLSRLSSVESSHLYKRIFVLCNTTFILFRLNISRLRSVNNLEVKSILKAMLESFSLLSVVTKFVKLKYSLGIQLHIYQGGQQEGFRNYSPKNLSTVNITLGRFRISNGFGTKICHHCELMFSFLCSL